MHELKTNLFDYITNSTVDAICIPTNGNYTRSGIAIMNAGYAEECAKRWTKTPIRLGKLLRAFGKNIPFVIGAIDEKNQELELNNNLLIERKFKCLIFNYPVSNNLAQGSEINLIIRSAHMMLDYTNQYNLKNVILGCPEIEKIQWEEVKLEIKNILDDRFTIVYGTENGTT